MFEFGEMVTIEQIDLGFSNRVRAIAYLCIFTILRECIAKTRVYATALQIGYIRSECRYLFGRMN
jgi:hypothetical protein